MAKRLAITIAGAVSLGSYEAGVLSEILDAIAQHNADSQTTPDDKIVVDVITGASAGGMTAVILAQKLLYSALEFKGPYDNPLYNTWVKRISLAGLQATDPNEKATQSMFSSDLIETISEETLLARYENVPPAAVPHRAVGTELRIGLALTNLNGVVPYGYQVHPNGSFTYLDYSDQLTRHVVAAQCDKRDFWEVLRRAAVACGAFPFAFRTQGIQRSKADDPDDYTGNVQWNGAPTTFTYSDGGILQNQPLGISKNLVDQIDNHVHERRFYLFISPHAKDPTSADIDPDTVNIFEELRRIVTLVMGQSGFHDWITAHGINERVRLLDKRAQELAANMAGGSIDKTSLAITAGSILQLFFPNGTHRPPGATKDETLQEAKTRIAKQYAAEAANSGAAAAFLDAVLAFESAAQLGARDLMTIYGITVIDNELAGSPLQSFLGFFDRSYREHDYDIGRTHAQLFLADPNLVAADQLGALRYTPTQVRPIDKSLNGLRLDHVDSAIVTPFRDGLELRVKQLLHELPHGWVLATPLAEVVVRAVIQRVMPDK